MPAGTPRAVRRGPRGFAVLGEFPQGEVERIALAFAGFDPRADLEFVDVASRERAVPREAPYGIIHAILDDVRVSPFDERRDHREDLADVRRRARLAVGRQQMQPFHRTRE